MSPRARPRMPPARSNCPVATTLDLLGDKWTLLVVRDLVLFGPRRFGDFLESPEKIPTNLLTNRLRRLECAGLVRRRPYQRRPVRYEYELTPAGVDLREVLDAMARWANRHVPGTMVPPPGTLGGAAAKVRLPRTR